MRSKGLQISLKTIVLILILLRICAADYSSVREGTLEEKARGRLDFVIQADVDVTGKIRVISNQTGNIKITYTITALAESKAEANRFLGLVDIRLDTNRREKAFLEILSPSHVPWGGSKYNVNVEILAEIPEKINIEGKCRFSDLEVMGPFQNIDLDCENSSVSLSMIYGSVRISTTNSSIVLKSIKGDLRAETTNGSITIDGMEIEWGYAFLETTNGGITLEDIQGSIEAYTTYSPIKVDNIDASEGSVVLRTNYAPIDVSNVVGEIICETNYYPVNILDSNINHGHSKIETSYAPVRAQFDKVENCEVYISSGYNNIELEVPSETSARLVASVDKGGRIHAKGIAIIPVLLEPTYLEGVMGEGDARIEVKVNGIGNIDITGR
ncbi:MAG: DUF4097 family beta strand repeat protein [Candidatus Zixiibacteriota bacterium]|nr:MAG: DUF4097 family beta strand repeat protein [candidate division Zixibacteria bacterium]